MNLGLPFQPSSLERRAKVEQEIATKACAIASFREYLALKFAGDEGVLRLLSQMSDAELKMQCDDWARRAREL